MEHNSYIIHIKNKHKIVTLQLVLEDRIIQSILRIMKKEYVIMTNVIEIIKSRDSIGYFHTGCDAASCQYF